MFVGFATSSRTLRQAPQTLYKTVVLHYHKLLTNDKILSKNSPKLAYGK
jgi:hypothetical protein